MEKIILVGVHLGLKNAELDTNDASIKELELLAKTAALDVCGIFVQNRHSLEGGTYIGEGKIEEIAEFVRLNDIDKVVFDDELTGIQTRNLANLIGVPIVDRSALILDIFAGRAKSREGKLQVELAQLRYMLPRLAGSSLDTGLSRAGVGVGARGPGETKLETDRRQIHQRIDTLKEQLHEVAKNRATQRRERERSGAQQVALLGYTNAGKSTLLNALTDSDVLAEDMLFATLDPTARKYTMPDGADVIFIDTVGFIRKLPHHLIRAFSSTLEESMLCDVILHVMDSSSEELSSHKLVVDNLISELNRDNRPVLYVYNKIDKVGGADNFVGIASEGEDSAFISAKTREGIPELLEKIQGLLPEKRRRVQVLIPYDKGDLSAKLHELAQVESEEFLENGTKMDAIIAERDFHLISEFLV